MKKRFRRIYFLVSTITLGLLHLSFTFAKSVKNYTTVLIPVDSSHKKIGSTPDHNPVKKTVYDSLHLNLKGLSLQAFEYAKEGFRKLVAEGKLANDSILSIIDFSKPSNSKRLFILDLKNYRVLFNTLVAHGRNTGKEWANSFSNQNASYKSSPGFYITAETYNGKNGYSLKLEGIEKGINDHAYERGIVIHGADYVCDAFVKAQGYIGRSLGCPAVPLRESAPIINTIKEGSCLFIYHPDYIRRSALLD